LLKGIEHVAVAVADLDETLDKFEKVFRLQVEHREFIESYGVEIATVRMGNTCIEFVEGKSEDSPIRKFVEKKGPGIHHIAFAVDDITSAIEELTKNGVDMIDKKPRRGKDDSLVAFVHPKSTGKILCELVQTRRSKEK
jgi:methylmalonyl-CoA epimerase